ncbi:YbfB/YjiJ family MFS transporter [Roseomonas sp. CCTCC AB2023176]|uniref:YbfB/YjiJ family MFS transporter n=1 Tax=Roseomonas sp. CCTCC AB2023176 TaxID=3342640 RepID=UPI0035D5AFE6
MRDPSLRPALAGTIALCTGIGLARFAYVPLFPAMVTAGWVGGGEAGLLGAANFTGHLAGALTANRVAARLGTARALDAGVALVLLAFLACALHLLDPWGVPWFAAWRTLGGYAGGVLLSVTGPAVQAVTPPERRGAAGGIVMAGVGVGVVLVSLTVPPLLALGGVAGAWLGLGALTAVLWAFAHPAWPVPPPAPPPMPGATAAARTPRGILWAYALSGAGMTAPMIYLSDLAARGHGLGVALGGMVWGLFGLGVLAGTLLGGRAADRLGASRTMLLWLAVQVAALTCTLVPHPASLVPAALLSGFAGVGITAVALAGIRAAVGAATPRRWAAATALYGLLQVGVGYALAAIFAGTGGSHAAVFGVGLVLSVAGLAVAARDVARR